MTADCGNADDEYDRREEGESEEDDGGAGAYAALVGLDSADLEATAPPLYVPRIPGRDYPEAMSELREWVEELVERFGHLDHTVIPVCWWRHRGHVEILQALRDHERVSYADTAAGTAGMSWQRELFFAEARLREWTGYFGCASGHKDPIRQVRVHDAQAWKAHLEVERERRDLAAMRAALED
jgi:hypothetical protein